MHGGRWIMPMIVFLACIPATLAGAAEADPAAAVADYIDAVHRGAWDEARGYWSPAYLAEAGALGITYVEVPCPWDLASPVILDHISGTVREYRIEIDHRDSDLIAVSIAPVAGGATPWGYALVLEGGTWRLADRIWAAGRRWPVRDTRYCMLRGPEVHGLDDRACAELDGFIEDCASSLGADAAALADLARIRIPYYVTDDATVAALTGHPTKGMANLAAGAVISSHFPHFHELVHLLVNWVLRDVSLFTHPLLQEGLACRLGGRWGRAGEVILYTGWFHLDLGLSEVADVLTWDGFHAGSGGADGNYAVSALVCELVREQAGWAGLMRLYEQLSGPLERLRSMSGSDVAGAVVEVCGWSTDDPVATLTTAVEEQASRWRRCGVTPGGGDNRDDDALRFENERGRLVVQPIGRTWSMRLQAVEYPCGVVLSPLESVRDAGADPWSSLYAEQWPGRKWDGARWGVVCRPETVGLYDYVTNRLVATWVADFSGEPHLGEGDQAWLEFTVTVPDELHPNPPGGLLVRLE